MGHFQPEANAGLSHLVTTLSYQNRKMTSLYSHRQVGIESWSGTSCRVWPASSLTKHLMVRKKGGCEVRAPPLNLVASLLSVCISGESRGESTPLSMDTESESVASLSPTLITSLATEGTAGCGWGWWVGLSTCGRLLPHPLIFLSKTYFIGLIPEVGEIAMQNRFEAKHLKVLLEGRVDLYGGL